MPERIQLRRTKGWRKPEGAVVVSRPSIWGNPWRPGRPGTFWLPDFPVADMPLRLDLDAAEAVNLYSRLLTGGPDPVNAALPAHLNAQGRRCVRHDLRDHAARIRARLPELRGRDLCCWCPVDEPCHADVLLEMANE